MAFVVTIGGSPSGSSRSAAVLDLARQRLQARGNETEAIVVRSLNPEDLIYERYESPALKATFETVSRADGIIIATPIYKAAYSGVLKVYLDLLPANSFAQKVVLPMATGGSPAHTLVIDYALRPVLTALGSSHILGGVYLIDSEIKPLNAASDTSAIQLETSAAERFEAALDELMRVVASKPN